jgi:hypothetical protein
VIDDAQRLVGFAFVVVDFAADLGVPRNDLTGGGNRFVPAVADPDAGFVVGGESPPLAIARLLRPRGLILSSAPGFALDRRAESRSRFLF